jgi:hypothetical protein
VKIAILGGRALKLEEAFEQAEKAAKAAELAARRLVASARALAKAASDGDIGRIRRASEKLSQDADTARQDAGNACSSWPLSPEAEEQYLSGEYTEELLRSADAGGLKIQRQDSTIISYPFVIRVLPSQRLVMLNRKRVAGLRPSRLVARLKAIQNSKSRANPQTFLEAVFAAYRLIAGGDRAGAAISLAEIFRILTLLPGADYSKEDFARDLLSLDRSGTTVTRSGARVSFPASTGTRDARNTFMCVAPDGEMIPFYAVKFTEEMQ